MKITKGISPWRLLYVPWIVIACIALAATAVTSSWNKPLGQWFYLSFAAFMAWWVFLTVRSGVVPHSFGPATHRTSNPFLFWWSVSGVTLLAIVFVAFSVALSRG